MWCWSWIHAGKFHFAYREASDPIEQVALCASQKLSERMRCTLHEPLIHGLRTHSPDGSHDKWHETMLLKLTKCMIFTQAENIFKLLCFRFLPVYCLKCKLKVILIGGHLNISNTMMKNNNTFQTTYRYLCLPKLQRKTQAYP